MSLNTRFANLANILDEKGQSEHVLVIESPVLVGDDWDRLRAYFGDAVADIDCTSPAGGDAAALRDALSRIRREAEDAVRARLGTASCRERVCQNMYISGWPLYINKN